jgi:hypothetical protein
MRALVLVAAVAATFAGAPTLHAQPTPDRAKAMAKLAFMNGIWVGPASGASADGSHYEVTQTERMGPMLGGDIIVIEGRGYAPDGSTAFNAFAVVSWVPGTGKYELRSYAQGYAGTFDLVPTDDGYRWEIPAGPVTIRYTATIKDGTWHEIGERIAPGQPAVQIFEMNLKRVGDTDWPVGTPVSPKAAPAR